MELRGPWTFAPAKSRGRAENAEPTTGVSHDCGETNPITGTMFIREKKISWNVPSSSYTVDITDIMLHHRIFGTRVEAFHFAVLLVEAKSDQLLDKFHVPGRHCTSDYPIPIISFWMNSTTTERSVFDPRNTSLDSNSFNKSKHVSPGPIHTNPQPIQNRSCFTRTA